MVIPVHNALAEFREMIRSLREHTKREEYRLIIVDDASDGETREFIAGLDHDVLLTNDRQLWFSRAVNRGLDKTLYPFVAVLNTDILLCEGWLNVLLGYFKQDDVMLVGSDYNPSCQEFDFPVRPDYLTGHCWIIRRWFMENHGTLDEKYAHIDSDRHFSYMVNDKGFKIVRNHRLPVRHGTGPSWGRRISSLPRDGTLPKPNNRKLERRVI